MKLSVIILTKNEEKMIWDCLESIDFADEIIIIDDGSSDKTLDIAREYQAKVYVNKKINFASQRNYALEKASGEWVLYLDADERVTPELQNEIEKIINNNLTSHSDQARNERAEEFLETVQSVLRPKDPSTSPAPAGSARDDQLNSNQNVNGYYVKRQNYYLGEKWPYIEQVQKLFRKEKLKGWFGDLHETPQIEGDYGVLNNPLLHYTHRNISEMVEKTLEWSKVEAQLRFNANHPSIVWWRFLRVMTGEFWRSYVTQKGYQAGTMGLIESMYQAFSIFITYARLYEMQKNKK